jgi:hypothetical protein
MASDYNAGTMLFNPIYKDVNGACEWCATNTTFNVLNPVSKAGVDNLDPELTIGNVTKTPVFRYKGGDASGTDWPKWTYGEDLDFVSDGSNPTYNTGSPGLGTNDDAITYNAGSYHEAPSSSTGDVTTEDVYFEALIYVGIEDNRYLISKYDNGVAGWYFYGVSSNKINFRGASSSTIITLSGTATLNAWNFVQVFIDQSENSANGGEMHINGVLKDSDNFSTLGSWTTTRKFSTGSINGGFNSEGCIAYAAMWKQADWMQGGSTNATEWAYLAAERFAKWSGRYPYIAKGNPTATTATRAFEAYLDKIESGKSVLYYVGSEWLRQCHRQDKNGVDFYGYLPEPQTTNLCQESEDFTTTWTKIDSGDTITSNAVACPDKRVVADAIKADSTSGLHGVNYAATLAADGYCFSIYAKAGNKNWIKLQNTTVSNCYAYFNLSTGAKGTSPGSGIIESHISNLHYNDFYRIDITFTGTAASHTLRAMPVAGEGSDSFAGDGSTANVYLWGAQIEVNGDIPTSLIVTNGATATRLKDQFIFEAGDNIGGEDIGLGTIVMDVLMPDYDKNDTVNFFSLSDGGSAADRVTILSATTAENARTVTKATGGDDGSVTPALDITDGEIHELRTKWDTNDLEMVIDGATSATDSDCDMPNDVDVMHVGSQYTGVGQSKALISNIRIYKIVTDKG